MTNHDLDQRVQALAARLEARGCWVSLDMRVREPVAAEVLGVTGRTWLIASAGEAATTEASA